MKKISLVLGGGGAKGFFHIGVIKRLKEENIEIKEIAGCSIGAIIGYILAAKPDIDLNKFFLNKFSIIKLFHIASPKILKKAFLDTKNIEKFLIEQFKIKTFEELKIPFSFNSTDLITGEEIIFRKGNIFPYIVSTMTIPGVFPPIPYKDKHLVDGGLTNNVPISLIKSKRKILAINLNPLQKEEINSRKEILANSFHIMQKNLYMQKMNTLQKIRTKIIEAQLHKYDIYDFSKHKAKKLMQLGYEQSEEIIKKLGGRK